MSGLTAADFATFVAEVHNGRRPFPWQSALVESVLGTGAWPEELDIPTGLGKTSVLDVAVFAAAANREAAPRRMFFVVDRKLIVDQAHDHATTIATALATPDKYGPVCGKVAQAVRLIDDDAPAPLSVTRMRGGITWDRMWVDRPDRYAIVTGTVDQIGSRVLFRGYGLTERARPIDAALVGCDSLIIIDEAHLSSAFATTLRAAIDTEPARLRPTPIVVSMSATTTPGTGNVHGITDADRTNPIAAARLAAAKTMHLVAVPTNKDSAAADMATAMAELAASQATAARVTLVVANTVDRARRTFDILKTNKGADVVLWTGRAREVDKQALTRAVLPRIRADKPETGARPIIVVATQTIEVGADIDAEAAVIESTAVAALIQRLGRLNRLGCRNSGIALVVHDKRCGPIDPVYGPARLATWEYLTTLATPVPFRRGKALKLKDGIDASPNALQHLAANSPKDTQAPKPYVPVLFPTTMDSWVRTCPTPVPDTPVAPYLHGLTDIAAPVSVVWRDELSSRPTDEWIGAVDALPPSADETIDVPLPAVRRWLKGLETGAVSDMEATIDSPEPRDTASRNRAGIDYSGDDSTIVSPNQLRPGMTLVVPTSYGGCDAFGWNPHHTATVTDVADLCHRHRRYVLRLGATLPGLGAWCRRHSGIDITTELDALARLGRAVDPPATSKQLRTVLGTISGRLSDAPASIDALRDLFAQLADPDNRLSLTTWTPDLVTGTPANPPWDVLVSVKQPALRSDDDTLSSSATGTAISLQAHQEAVAARARTYASNLSLPAEIVDAVAIAAVGHDEGKRDPRAQIMMHRGDRLAAELAEHLLAKSGMDSSDRPAFRRARRASGYPARARHEELSARIAAHQHAGHPLVALICHLIAAHHGYARPLLPAAPDPHNPTITLPDGHQLAAHAPVDLNHASTFHHLNHHYGRWSLALLETIVRLADQTASARNEGVDT